MISYYRELGFAITTLGWSPEIFWAATRRELMAAADILDGEDRRENFAAFKREVEKGLRARQK